MRVDLPGPDEMTLIVVEKVLSREKRVRQDVSFNETDGYSRQTVVKRCYWAIGVFYYFSCTST